MPNYQNGKLYKISGGGLIYIGSTTVSCSQRLAQHRSDYENFKKGKKNYITSFQLLDFDDCMITLIEDFKCERKEQLLAQERFHIENNICVNKNIPGRTKPESNKNYYDNNKEEIQDKHKIY